MRIHKVEEGCLAVGEGTITSWVIASLVVKGNNVSVELQLRIGSVGGLLVRTVSRGGLRQVWRGDDEVIVEMIVELRHGGMIHGTEREV